ncbi:MAG: long-chain-fatty-acid--CoA ligase [Rhodospirillales bacterium]|nr:long-chain-fatty-acid--CoA ligase [Rhodospirillales bacterium]
MAQAVPTGAGANPWHRSYPDGIPHAMTPSSYTSVADLIETNFPAFAARPAFSCMGKSMSYATLAADTAAFASFLQSLGLKKGDRIALMMPNILPFPVALAGALRAGLIVVNVNPLYTPRELEHQLIDSGAKAIVVLENFAHVLEQVVARTDVEHVVVTRMGDMLGPKGVLVNAVVRHVRKLVPAWRLPGHHRFSRTISVGRGFDRPKLTPDDIAFLQYTGGTTGVAKGAILTHGNILSNLQQNRHWAEVAYNARGRPEQITFICALPLYHIFALAVNALTAWDQGGHNILIPNPRDIPALVKDLGRHRWHFFAGLNTLFNALLSNDDFRKLDFSPVKLVMSGGMALQRATAERWKDVTGADIYEGYGLSETSPVATANRFDAIGFTGTVGLPMPSTEIAIRDEDGNDLPVGNAGEVCIRGPQVMKGYWNRPHETAASMTADGYFKTGDIGTLDQAGFLRIVDRKKDMIIVSGFNVYPNEIEEVAAGHPDVIESAAIAVPDDKTGEAVKLFVVRRIPTLTEADLRKHCAAHLTNYKRPRFIEFRDDLPKSPVGKILRRELRDAG